MSNWGVIHPTAVIGDPPEHRDWINGQEELITMPVIDASARINSHVTVDAGLARLGNTTRVGRATLLMAKVHVGHNALVGNHCELAPGVTIGGNVVIEDGVKIGINASVLPFITIGEGARIGMGSVVLEDVPANEVWAGNPARKIR